MAVAFFAPALATAQTLDEIIAMNLKAKGGIDKIRATSTVRMTAHVNAKDDPSGQAKTATVMMFAKRPNMMRREQVVDGDTIVSAFDGKTLWMSRGNRPPQAAPGPQAAYTAQDAEFDSVFVEYKEKGHSVELVGRDKRNGKDVFHLRVTKKGGPPQDYYLDASTGLEQTISVTVAPGGKPTTITTELGDYREVDGRMVPFSIRQLVDGAVTASTTLDKVEFNVPADDALFRMPESPKPGAYPAASPGSRD
jgi:outer membrane lipoprotein-sorting protein